MASSSSTRWRVACDTCDVSAWIGPQSGPTLDSPAGREAGHQAERELGRKILGTSCFCESCQTPHELDSAAVPGARCPRCGAPLAAYPRFVELWGELQHLDAVLAAWAGDLAPLATLLPERPRFVTDLTPPGSSPGDPPERAAQLAAVAHGEWRGALAAPPDADPRALAARAIAHERRGDSAQALAAWDAVLAAGEDARARLARGALLARAGRFAAAGEDLARAGDSFEARWNRAALLVHEGVAASEGLPDAAVLTRARAEAGPASAYWSDPTIGRLLWSLLIERERARHEAAGPRLAETARAAFRAAESEFEHATFWDRAMVLVGWARLGAMGEVARVAAPLARERAATLLDEPALTGAALADLAGTLAAARTAMDLEDPVEARHGLAEALARPDLRRFRIPCAACGRGTLGIAETTELEG